jgi:hypothetical protein
MKWRKSTRQPIFAPKFKPRTSSIRIWFNNCYTEKQVKRRNPIISEPLKGFILCIKRVLPPAIKCSVLCALFSVTFFPLLKVIQNLVFILIRVWFSSNKCQCKWHIYSFNIISSGVCQSFRNIRCIWLPGYISELTYLLLIQNSYQT